EDDERYPSLGGMKEVGALIVVCPRCAAEITIPIQAGIVKDPEQPGKLYVRTTSDVADYWSHSFTHLEAKDDG
ncbi:MAG: hypothetical protein LC723_07390, partial [Actinobacteria bacterium]|nr:hypothetical protein [Actinomycetota bacterium]